MQRVPEEVALITVHISVNDGIDFKEVQQRIKLVSESRIYSISPDSGPSTGMTTIVVSGLALHTAFGGLINSSSSYVDSHGEVYCLFRR